MTSATVEIWKDTGYTEGCMEVPKTSSTLSDPDFTFSGLEISTSSLFSEVKVKEDFESLYDCSYLRMTLEMNNGDDVVVYGWIDSVSVGSDSASSPMTRIQWHVDMWRTYISQVTFGSGIIKRRTAEGDLPTQPYTSRYSMAKTPRELFPESDWIWVYLNYTYTETSGDTSFTKTNTMCYPVDPNDITKQIIIFGLTASYIGKCPSYVNTVEGSFDELLGLDPDAVYGAFLSPVPPGPVSVEPTSKNWYTIPGWANMQFKKISDTSGFYTFRRSGDEGDPYALQSFTTMAQTTDTTSYILTDMDRQPVGVLPWGIAVNGGTYRIVNCDTTMYLSLRFNASSGNIDGMQPVNGLEFTIPMKTIGVTSNAKSSYIYSGQQELDREQMAIQRTQALQSGLVNIGNQAVQGALSGGILGALGGPGGVALGAAVGAGSSIIGSAIGTAGEYAISGIANDKMMDATLRQKAQQTSYMTMPSAGQDWVYNGHVPQLIPFQWDDYSITQRAQDMQLYGAHVDEPRTSCQDLLMAGGPLQIANLVVTGSVPVQAKTYIKQRLANGVRIV